jgi:hypothetical protein
VSGGPVPFVWLCGASGVGKSSVGWEIFTQLSRAGIRTAYVDADQLGLCYPCADPDTHQVKARNLGAVWPGFQAAGARCLVFSGSAGTADLVRAYAEQLPGTALRLCVLRAGAGTLRERYLRRGWMPELAEQALAEAAAIERGQVGGLRIDTDGLSVAEVARLVRERVGGWPPATPAPATPTPVTPAPVTPARWAVPPAGQGRVPLLWLCGPPAVGKSTVGWDIFTQVAQAGIVAAYVDLAQIGFCRPPAPEDPGNHRLTARNLGAMWPVFAAAGARCLVISGGVPDPDTVQRYADALPATVLTLCRLRAGTGELTDRVLRRGRGAAVVLPGDELNGQPPAALHRFAQQAAREAAELDRARLGGLCVDTDGRAPQEIAGLVRAIAGDWPSLA